jgi:hypothetical protein
MENWIGSNTTLWGAQQWLNGDGTGNYQVPGLLVNEKTVGTGICPYLNISLNGTSSNLMPLLGQLMLGNRYVSLNPTLTTYIPENAHTEPEIKALLAAAGTVNLDAAKSLLNQCWGG